MRTIIKNKNGPAVILAAEDDEQELRRRLILISAEAEVTIRDLSDLHIVTLAGEDAFSAVGPAIASPEELAAYCLATFKSMPRHRQAGFLDHVHGR